MITTDCPFCRRWLKHEYVAKLGEVICFEPLNPVTPGHMLFVPTEHTEWGGFLAAPYIGVCMREAAFWAARHKIESYNLITSNGEPATQTVAHVHVHLVPRTTGDNIKLPWTDQRLECPDGGTCHHSCTRGCWRVANAGPLSSYGDDWSAEDVLNYSDNDGRI